MLVKWSKLVVKILVDGTTSRVSGSNISFTKNSDINEKKDNSEISKRKTSIAKYVAPVVLVGSGAVLMYLGVSAPSYQKELTKIFKNKLNTMAHEADELKKYLTEIFEKEYQKMSFYIEKYKNNKTIDITTPLSNIQDARDGSEVLKTVNEVFTHINKVRAQRNQPHLSEMDEFRDDLFKFNHSIYERSTTERNGTSMKLLDLSIMPRFKNDKCKTVIDSFEEKLCKIKERLDKEMFDTQNRTTDEHLHNTAKEMVQTVITVRNGFLSSAQTVMEAAFGKFAKMYNLGDDFQPIFKAGKSLKPLKTLTKEQLKPQILSDETKNLIADSYLIYVLENINFSKLQKKNFEKLFSMMPGNFDVKQLDLITDKIRLQQVMHNVKNNADNPEYTAIIKKLEHLSAKLEETGKQKLIEKTSRDFSGLTHDQLHAKLYYINCDARRLGLRNLDDIEAFLAEKSSSYSGSSFEKIMPLFKANPLKFFM